MKKNDRIKDILRQHEGAQIREKDFEVLAKSFGVEGVDGVLYRLRKLEKEGFLEKVTSEGGYIGWAIVASQNEAGIRNDHPPILENFGDVEISIFKTATGYVVPIASITKAIGTDKSSAMKLLQRNSELFESFIAEVYDPKTKRVYKCLTRDGIIGYVIKLSSGRLSGKVKEQTIAFQKWAIETLGALLEQGTVEISPEEYEKSLVTITGLSKENLQKVVVGLKRENAELKKQKHRLAKLNEGLVGDVVYLKERLLQRNII